MKNLKYLSLILMTGLLIFSCTKEEDENPFLHPPKKGAVAVFQGVTGFFDIVEPSTSSISFDLNTKGEPVNSIEIFKSIKGGAESSFSTVSSFPTNISVSFDDVLAGSGLSASDMAPGDQANFRTMVTTATGTYPGASVSFDFSCSSNLAGMMDVTTVGWCGDTYTGVAEMVETGAGTYTFTDMSFGAYEACYGAGSTLPEGDLEIVDICNKLSYTGQSQWAEIYEFLSMTVDGPSLTFAWKNSYDPEAGTTTLVRQDGKDWPALSY